MTAVVVGLGLIGGSMAKAIKKNTDFKVFGMDIEEDVLLDALSCGAIDGKAGREELSMADWVIICLYPKETLEFARDYGPLLKEGCVLLDTCGIKREVCAGMKSLRGTGIYTYIGGHPMAGKEKKGFGMSEASLFSGASFLMVEGDAPRETVQKTEKFILSLGFGRVIHTDPETHDSEIAFTSQLPHAIACAYVMSPRARTHDGFSAGSYRDVSRVADINSELWTKLFLLNREPLLEEIEELKTNLNLIEDAIEREDSEGLRSLLEKAGKIKREIG